MILNEKLLLCRKKMHNMLLFHQRAKWNQPRFALHHDYFESKKLLLPFFVFVCFKAMHRWRCFKYSDHIPADSIWNGWPYEPVCSHYLQQWWLHWLISCIKRRVWYRWWSHCYSSWWRDQHSCWFLQLLFLLSVLICTLFMEL